MLALVKAGMLSSIGQMVRVWGPSSWYFPYVVAGLALYLLRILYGFFVSLRGRKLFSTEFLGG
jgi:hypothetical protein